MTVLILGLVVFLGVHSVRLVAPDWRARQVARVGEGAWKGLYSVASAIGLALTIWGFGLARAHPVRLYATPLWLHHLNALLTLAAFVLVAAAYVPRNRLKSQFGHPMLLGAAIWAVGHLLATGNLRDLLLFGGFLIWAAADYVVSRRRDRRSAVRYGQGSVMGTLIAVVVGVVAWAVFAFWLHSRWIGVSPFA